MLSPQSESSGGTAALPEEHNEIAALAEAIKAAGMAGPAVLALHIAKPFHWMGGQMMWVLQPFLGRRSGPFSLQRLAGLLEREGGVDDLIEQLDPASRRT